MRKNLIAHREREEREKRALAGRSMHLPVTPSSAAFTSQLKWLVWLLILSQGTAAQVRHTSKGETDRFLLCSRSLFQKPVYTTVVGPGSTPR